ncbi:MAG: hypothetical protein JWQ48_3614 [Conexibacter sp.]|jgi:hypothetical protein|nr:hypothetical protein [Conexibacter sp.]
MQRSSLMKTGAVVGACAAVGAGAGILGSAGAATTPAQPPGASGAGRAAQPGTPGRARARRRGAGAIVPRRAVHGSVVVPARGGTFRTLTFDRGVVKAVVGDRLTLTEGTRRATYKTVTLTIPSDAKVRDNRRKSTLSTLTAGQRVVVVQGGSKTHVVAHDARRRP